MTCMIDETRIETKEHTDISNAISKRHRYFITINQEYDKDRLIQFLLQLNDKLIKSSDGDKGRKLWPFSDAHGIFLFVYKDDWDYNNNNDICKLTWIDSNNPIKEDIVIENDHELIDSNTYLMWNEIHDPYREHKGKD